MSLRARRVAMLATAAAVTVATPPAALAVNDLFAKDAPIARMTQEDFDIAGAVMRKALDEGQDGTAYPWKNPATSASGTVTPLAPFTRQGLRCRGAAFTITTRGETSRSRWNLCHTPDGWKVAEGR